MSKKINLLIIKLVLLLMVPMSCQATIKIGILHSLSGTMAISETELKQTIEMLIQQQNKAGGLLGQKLEAIVYDTESNWPKFAVDAKKMIVNDKVNVIFGCWTSVSRKHVLPIIEKYNGLLFYPVQFEGEELSENIYYSGATPNQQAIPAVDYLLSKGHNKFFLLGTDYVYPQTINNIVKEYLIGKGISESDIVIEYTPFGFQDWGPTVSKLKIASEDKSKKIAVVSTINGDANIGFYSMLADSKITSKDVPVIAFSVGENELKGMDTAPLVGHLSAWNYFMSGSSEENDNFIENWQEFKEDDSAVTNDPMEATYLNFKLWVKGVEKAGTTDPEAVSMAMNGMTIKGLSGVNVKMDKNNHHFHKPVLIGEIQADGQFNVVWSSTGLVSPSPLNNNFKLCEMQAKDYIDYVHQINPDRVKVIEEYCQKDVNFKICDLPANELSAMEENECKNK